jgi:hypothetical protein
MGKLSDRILLAVVRWRLAYFRRPGDRADKFGDALVSMLAAEEQAKRVAALNAFEGLGSGDRPALQ